MNKVQSMMREIFLTTILLLVSCSGSISQGIKSVEYMGQDRYYDPIPSEKMEEWIECGIPEGTARGGQYSNSELDKMCEECKEERSAKNLTRFLYILVAVIILATIIGVSYKGSKQSNSNRQLDKPKGMRQKYPQLINWLCEHPNVVVSDVTMDYITITNTLKNTMTCFYLMHQDNILEVEWKADLGIMGKHKQEWVFDFGTKEDEMIKRIELDLIDLDCRLNG